MSVPPDRIDVDVDVEAWLSSIGKVFARFDATTQDSGNISFGVQTDDCRWFVKTAGDLGDPAGDGHAARAARLRNAIVLSRSLEHPALPRLRGVVEAPLGPALVYEWADGELLGTPPERRTDPTTAGARFRALSVSEVLAAIGTLTDLHVALADAGWVAGDLYLGCLIYDMATHALTVVDLDHYTRGPTRNTMGRMYGSTRLMPPEELTLGAAIDQRSTVFTLARITLSLLTDEALDRSKFRGSPSLLRVIDRATAADPDERYPDVASYAEAVRASRIDTNNMFNI